MTEGDLVIVFSQYGEIVDCRIVREKETGKSKGFAFICYQDQKSTILAVDNLNGANICDRVIRVDHVEQYKIPKEYFEVDEVDESGERKMYKPSGPDGKGWGEDRVLSSEDLYYFNKLKKSEMDQEQRINKVDETKFVMDEDERWEREFLKIVDQKKEDELKRKKEKAERKKKKKEKKLKRKEKDAKKENKKKLKDAEDLKRLHETYDLKNIEK
jgi:RNA-binding motif X-linked protein 2